MNEVDYCLMVVKNAKDRGNTSCQVPIWAQAETIEKLKEMGYVARQIGFDPSEPYAHVEVKF